MIRKLLAAVALLALCGAASAQYPPTTSNQNPFGGYNYSNGGYSSPNVFGGYNYYPPSGGMTYSRPNVFGGYNYNSGGYTTPNPFGGYNYYGR